MTHPQYPYSGYGQDDNRDQYPYVYPTYNPDQGWVPAGYAPSAYPPPPASQRTRGRRTTSLLAVAALAAAAVVGVSIGRATTSTSGVGSATALTPTTPGTGNSGGSGSGSTTIPTFPGNGGSSSGNNANPANPANPGNGNTSANTAEATAVQQIGVVDIYTKLKYERAAAAGTGLVIDSDGVILTNNHVIDGSTTIKVVVVATGKTYTATVVGTAPTEDIAVLKLADASGLKTANLGDSDTIKVGDKVTGVGNAGGTGGTPSAASGTIQSLNETITASDETGTDSEKLKGIIATDAPIQSGDSGGPLYNSDDQVIGIDTAASTSGKTAGFAIPIKQALKIATQIRSGIETTVIHIGYPAFLGVGVKNAAGAGALIDSTETGLPADKAGIVAGDIITSLNGSKVTSATTLRTAITKVNPGQTVSVSYTDANGAPHQVQVTLITGPAD